MPRWGPVAAFDPPLLSVDALHHCIQLNMDNVVSTMRKLGIKTQSRLTQRETLKDFATQLEMKVIENLKIRVPFVTQALGSWRFIGGLLWSR